MCTIKSRERRDSNGAICMEEASLGDIGVGLSQIATEEHLKIENRLSQVEQIAIEQEVFQTSSYVPSPEFQEMCSYLMSLMVNAERVVDNGSTKKGEPILHFMQIWHLKVMEQERGVPNLTRNVAREFHGLRKNTGKNLSPDAFSLQ